MAAWRSRGKVPVAVCATASLVEITLLDTEDTPIGQWCLRHLYSMALIRLINALVDTAQKGRFALSVDALLRRLEWPSWLGDLRHEATHGSLPAIELLRLAAQTALSKLHERFWLPQQDAVMESEHAYAEDTIRIRRLVTRLCKDPSDEEVVAEVVSFGSSSSRRAVTMVTSLVDRTVETGDVEPLKAFCELARPAQAHDELASHVQIALCAIQKPLRRRLLQPQTPVSRIRPMCELFKSMDIDASQWAMMEKMVVNNVCVNGDERSTTSGSGEQHGQCPANTSSASQAPKRLPVIDNMRAKQILGYKRRRTCSETVPWMEVGYAWSWDMGATYSGSPFECTVRTDDVDKEDDTPVSPIDLYCAEDGLEMRGGNVTDSSSSVKNDFASCTESRMEVDEQTIPKASCSVPESEHKNEGKSRKINISLLPGITSLF